MASKGRRREMTEARVLSAPAGDLVVLRVPPVVPSLRLLSSASSSLLYLLSSVHSEMGLQAPPRPAR